MPSPLAPKPTDVASDILLPPARVNEQLRQVPGPASLDDGRLVRLAALASLKAAVSARLELYPRGMPAARAAKLAKNLAPTLAVGCRSGRHPHRVRHPRRVRSRFPRQSRCPTGRPSMIFSSRPIGTSSGIPTPGTASAGIAPWSVSPSPAVPARSSFSRRCPGPGFPMTTSRRPRGDSMSACAPHRPGGIPAADRGAEVPRTGRAGTRAAVRPPAAERRTRAHRRHEGGGLGRPRRLGRRRPHGRRLRLVARLDKPAGPGSPCHAELDEALPQSAPPVLLTYPGLLASYRRLSWVSDVAQRSGRANGLHGAWLLVPWEDPGVPPSLDGQPIPVLPSQRAHIPDGWLANRHRSGADARG